MSTTISVGTDLKDYLNTRTTDKPSLKTNLSNLFNGNKAKEWFYQPLATEEGVDSSQLDSVNGSLDGNNRQLFIYIIDLFIPITRFTFILNQLI